MDWQNLLVALCLVLIIESLMPFLNPQAWKGAVSKVIAMDNRSIRSAAFICMMMGVIGLLIVRS